MADPKFAENSNVVSATPRDNGIDVMAFAGAIGIHTAKIFFTEDDLRLMLQTIEDGQQ